MLLRLILFIVALSLIKRLMCCVFKAAVFNRHHAPSKAEYDDSVVDLEKGTDGVYGKK